MMDQKGYKRSTHNYDIPPLVLVDKDNNKVSINEALATDEPVMLNFIFTTCTTICPVLSATFKQVQRELGDEADQVRMISITIDPEYDTPERLRDYAVRFKAGPQWQFYTGANDDIVAVQKAFDAYRGSKANHEPLTFLRVPSDPQWVRVNGLASAADVVKEYRQLLAE
jgi:protein SCO1/2